MDSKQGFCSCGAEVKAVTVDETGKRVCSLCCKPMSGEKTAPPRLRLKALVVDDSAVSRRALRTLLQALGCEVAESPDAATALTAVYEGKPDVILLDHHMPKKTGLEFLKELKANTAIRHAHVVMHTVENDKNVILECMRAGAADFIVKPAQKSVLFAKLNRLATRVPARSSEQPRANP